jgi:hypothetical protein
MATHIHLNYLGRLLSWVALLLLGVFLLGWLLFGTPARGIRSIEQISYCEGPRTPSYLVVSR